MRDNQTWNISTDQGWQSFEAMRNNLVLAGKNPRAQFVGEKRSLDQNALSHSLYAQIAAQVDDQSVNDIRAECKLRIGVGLLRASDERFREFYDSGLKQLTYEQKLAAMAYVPVTSIMGKKVFSAYVDEVIRTHSQQGISLINPSEADSYGT